MKSRKPVWSKPQPCPPAPGSRTAAQNNQGRRTSPGWNPGFALHRPRVSWANSFLSAAVSSRARWESVTPTSRSRLGKRLAQCLPVRCSCSVLPPAPTSMKASEAVRNEVGLQPPGESRKGRLILPGRAPLGGACISGQGEHEIVSSLPVPFEGCEREGEGRLPPKNTPTPGTRRSLGHALK